MVLTPPNRHAWRGHDVWGYFICDHCHQQVTGIADAMDAQPCACAPAKRSKVVWWWIWTAIYGVSLATTVLLWAWALFDEDYGQALYRFVFGIFATWWMVRQLERKP